MIRIGTDDFDQGPELQALQQEAGDAGAICSFTGLVRSHGDRQDVTGLFLEHYPGMTEKALATIVEEARSRWEIMAVRVIHRVGHLPLGDRIVFVGVASSHRLHAFEACQFIMDYLKIRAPFWKKEITAQGDHWVEQKTTDQNQADTWQNSHSD